MKRAALYMRVSTLDQHPETQMHDLHQMAEQRGYQIVEEYTDMISGAKARRPGLDAMMRDEPNDYPSGARLANTHCYKRAAKTGRLNPTESWPDLADPAVPQRVGCGTPRKS